MQLCRLYRSTQPSTVSSWRLIRGATTKCCTWCAPASSSASRSSHICKRKAIQRYKSSTEQFNETGHFRWRCNLSKTSVRALVWRLSVATSKWQWKLPRRSTTKQCGKRSPRRRFYRCAHTISIHRHENIPTGQSSSRRACVSKAEELREAQLPLSDHRQHGQAGAYDENCRHSQGLRWSLHDGAIFGRCARASESAALYWQYGIGLSHG